MKKYLFIFAAACVALCSCNKEATSNSIVPTIANGAQQECSFMAFNGLGLTKGYVETALFADTPYDKLHKPNYEPSVDDLPRTMLISAFLTPQSGIAGTYFKEATYKYSDTDNLWHNFNGDVLSPIYWPIGGQLDFLALSVTEDLAEGDLVWNEENVAQSFTLKVSDAFKQDDILFSSVCGRKIGTDPKVQMAFNHAQAWIQFQLNAGDPENNDETGIVTVKKVELIDIYSKGSVTVYNNLGKAFAKWDFREETRKDVAMDDTYDVTAAPLVPKDGVEGADDDTIGYMDMLIPEQQKTAFRITYTLKGQTNELTYYHELEHENWLMGRKYIYKIDFGTNEITVQPSVVTFTGNVEYEYPED